MFEFIHEVVFHASKVKVAPELLKLHRELKQDKSMIPVGKLGATSNVTRAEERSVRSFVRRSSVTEKNGALLFRITRWFRPDIILELGTGLGVSTLYLSSGAPKVPLHSIEGNTDRANFAAQLMCRCGLGPVSVHWGEMGDKLDDLGPLITGRLVAFVDGNHQYEPTLSYLRKIIKTSWEDAMIIMDDIHWSKGMYRAWKQVVSWQEVRISLDLFHFVILLLRKDLRKAHVKIKF
jgi:predicted O-methyltransferase YrrM